MATCDDGVRGKEEEKCVFGIANFSQHLQGDRSSVHPDGTKGPLVIRKHAKIVP